MTAENKRNRTERIIDMSSALAYVFLGHALVSRRHLADVARSSSKHQSGAEEAVIEIDWRLELAKTLASQGSRQVNILSIASTWCAFRRRRKGLFDDGEAALERQVAGE